MAKFFGISPGEEKIGPGIRVKVTPDGEDVWMHGKWLGLGPDHAVAWLDGQARFVTHSGKKLMAGQFPGWIVRGKGKGAPAALMFNIAQFEGGEIIIGKRRYAVASKQGHSMTINER